MQNSFSLLSLSPLHLLKPIPQESTQDNFPKVLGCFAAKLHFHRAVSGCCTTKMCNGMTPPPTHCQQGGSQSTGNSYLSMTLHSLRRNEIKGGCKRMVGMSPNVSQYPLFMDEMKRLKKVISTGHSSPESYTSTLLPSGHAGNEGSGS